jgi:hypothetical protein
MFIIIISIIIIIIIIIVAIISIVIKQNPRVCTEVFCDDGVCGRGGNDRFILLLETRRSLHIRSKVICGQVSSRQPTIALCQQWEPPALTGNLKPSVNTEQTLQLYK